MKRDLKYYLNLPYKIEIEQIPEEDGGGFAARLPELGKYALVGDGETIEEALNSLNEIKEIMFREWLEEGVSIPEPERDRAIDEFSGKFVIRIPKYLHYNLSMQAQKNGVSLNQFITSLLAECLERYKQVNTVKELLLEVKKITKHISEEKHAMNTQLSMQKDSFSNIIAMGDYEYSKAA